MEKENELEKICWDNFTTSGKIPDYLLYKYIKRREKEETFDGKFDNNKSTRFEDDSLSR